MRDVVADIDLFHTARVTPRYVLVHGDSLDVLKDIPDASCDSLVTDPPAGIGFMGKEWDHHKGGRKEWVAWMTDVMREAHRCLKPGAHGLVWALPRTSHWTATALEDAGFEVRDIITHLFGSGFPKSHAVDKHIDRLLGAEREPKEMLLRKAGATHEWKQRHGGQASHHMADKYIARKPGEKVLVNGDEPVTPQAARWKGWGTALKPASEHYILIRKPCSEKTVAANVLRHSTGAINIDASRISTLGQNLGDANRFLNAGCEQFLTVKEIQAKIARGETNVDYNGNDLKKVLERAKKNGLKTAKTMDKMANIGRFPANLILSHSPGCVQNVADWQCDDGCAVCALDEQSGISKSTAHTRGNGIGDGVFKSTKADHIGVRGISDTGGASRFFYCAKASRRDKGADNTHPTVKSTALMRYLIKLITPPGGVVLDPFMGSGSTGVSALRDGFRFVGVEAEREYVKIAAKRIKQEDGKNGVHRVGTGNVA